MDKNRALFEDLSNLSSDRSSELRRKARRNVKKSNITAQRVTLPPGFLSQCVQSEKAYKSKFSPDAPSNSVTVISESPHENTSNIPRRSNRLRRNNRTLSAVDYYLESLSDKTQESQTPTPRIPQNRSKSIFKEINQKYEIKQANDPDTIKINHDFSKRILDKLVPNFILKDSTHYKSKIFEELVVINEILTGGLQPVNEMPLTGKRPLSEDDNKENYPLNKLSYNIPQSNWVLQTPPNRKLNFNNLQQSTDNSIKPAVLENLGERRVVYEMNNKINVDLSRYSSNSQIDIDKRYMVEVANLRSSNSEGLLEEERHICEASPQKKINLMETDPCVLENYFSSLTCRPKKTVMARSRILPVKRKRDIFEPANEGLVTIDEDDSHMASAFNLSNAEESFTFQFTPSNAQRGTVGHFYDLDGNKKDSFQF